MAIEHSAEPLRLSPIELDRHEQLRVRLDKLTWELAENRKRLEKNQLQQSELKSYLNLAPEVSDALKTLSCELFEQDLRVLEEKMSIALQEVLKQPIQFRATTGFKGNVASVDFAVERAGHQEDLKRGQGGSVHNILSVGLRMFALTSLDSQNHRGFLMLDEQDCWLQPELVPKLVKIVHQASRELGYQVIMISHHDLHRFENYADRIYRFEPNKSSVRLIRSDAVDPNH